MRILHVASFSPFGGVETYVTHLLRGLAGAGHESVMVFTGDAGVANSAPAVQRHHLPDLHARDRACSRATASRMGSILDSARADVALLHTRMSEQTATTIMDRLPTTYFAHEYGGCCPAGALHFRHQSRTCDVALAPNPRCLVNAYLRGCNTRRPARLASTYEGTRSLKRWLSRVPLILCASSYVAERHVMAGYPRTRLAVNPYPIAVPPAVPAAPDPSPATVLCAARLIDHKGVQTLIDAVPMIEPRTRVVIDGSGPYLPELRRRTARLGVMDRVAFEMSPDVRDSYRRSSVIVVPSLWPEPFGLVGPEAMAHARPVVASDIGGIPEWLAPGTGILVPPGDPTRLASAVNQLLSDPAAAAGMGARGREWVMANLSMDGHLKRLLAGLEHAWETTC